MDNITNINIVESYHRVMILHGNETMEGGIGILLSYYHAAYAPLPLAFVDRVSKVIHEAVSDDPIVAFDRAMKILT